MTHDRTRSPLVPDLAGHAEGQWERVLRTCGCFQKVTGSLGMDLNYFMAMELAEPEELSLNQDQRPSGPGP